MQRREALPWLVLGTAALLPRLAGAVVRQPWHDEYYTVWAARLPFRDLLAALRLDSGPPLPYLLTRLLAHTGLDALAAARAIAVLAGVAAVLAAAVAARRAFGATAGWWTGVLLAAHPLAVAWSSEGRAYPLLLLAASMAWERLETLRTTGRGAIGLGVAVGLGCWSHGLGLVLAAAVVAAALTTVQSARARSLAAAAAGLAVFLPWLPVAAAQPGAAVAWMADAWRSLSWTARLAAPFHLLPPFADFGSAMDIPSFPAVLRLAAAAACLALLLSARFRPIPLALFAVPALALPILATLGVPAFYAGRGEALFLAPALGLMASGASRGGSRRWLAAALVAAEIGCVAVAMSAWNHAQPRREATVASVLARAMPEGGTVVTSGYWWLDLWYHLERTRRSFSIIQYPAAAMQHPGWYVDGVDRPRREELAKLGETLAAERNASAVIVTPGLSSAPDLAALAARLALRPRLEVAGGVLYLPSGRASERTTTD